jgi:hypothetical protein
MREGGIIFMMMDILRSIIEYKLHFYQAVRIGKPALFFLWCTLVEVEVPGCFVEPQRRSMIFLMLLFVVKFSHRIICNLHKIFI